MSSIKHRLLIAHQLPEMVEFFKFNGTHILYHLKIALVDWIRISIKYFFQNFLFLTVVGQHSWNSEWDSIRVKGTVKFLHLEKLFPWKPHQYRMQLMFKQLRFLRWNIVLIRRCHHFIDRRISWHWLEQHLFKKKKIYLKIIGRYGQRELLHMDV